MSNIINPYRFAAAAPPSFPNTYSADLDGISEWVSTSFDPNGNIGSGAYTYAYWFKADGVLGSQTLMYMGSNIESDNYNFMGLDDDNLKAVNRLDGGTVTYLDSTSLSTGTWYHVAMVRSASGENIKIYLNASLIRNSDSSYNATDFSFDSELFICGWWSGGYTLDGNVDEVAIWNAVLDSDNITAIYNSGAPTDLTTDSGNYDMSSNLILYLRMGDDDSGTGTTVTDESGNGNDGILESGATFVEDAP